MSITRRKSSKSERQTHRKSTSSKRNRREHNRSRLYENAQKLFEYQNPSKNQSIDAKLDKTASKHIKYTTLLSKDKKLKIVDKVEKSKQEESKSKKLKNNKYYSAPVSTKENGLVTKFKFNNTAKIEPEKQAPQKSGNVSQASEIDISHDVSQCKSHLR